MENQKKLTIAFDVDDTLIIPPCVTGLPTDVPNYETITIFRFFQKQGHTMVIWSGGGVEYARRWAEKLGLTPCQIRSKERSPFDFNAVDIAFDDCDVDETKNNLII